MDKNAIKKYAIYARNKLIQSATDKALTIGVSKNEIRDPDVQGNNYIIFTSSLGTKTTLTGDQIDARNKLINEIDNKGFDEVIEEVAYTWFNRLIAIRFMEVNDYLPSQLRVLSSDISGKKESDLMSNPFDADLYFTNEDKKKIISYKENNNLNELFNLLFIKQCNKLNEFLPGLFERMNEFTELILDIRYDDSEDVVYKLVHDIPEEDFNVSKGGQVEIIGWLYQYYNTELRNEVNKNKNKRITKENIPAKTQLFTPDWIVRFMVENSLGHLWIEGHPDETLKSKWKYYLDDVEQQKDVQKKMNELYVEYAQINPEDLSFFDPCMGSGHILCSAFDVLMQIYDSQGYSKRDAVKSIIKNNIYGLDIDDRAYQLAYFSIMMKARQYDRGTFRRGYNPRVYSIEESNEVTKVQLQLFGVELSDIERKTAINQMSVLIEVFHDAKEFGSILKVESMDWELLRNFVSSYDSYGKLDIMMMDFDVLKNKLERLIDEGELLSKKYWVTCTNPPYMTPTEKQKTIVNEEYKEAKSDLCTVFITRLNELVKRNGLQAMITMSSWMFLSSYVDFRDKILNETIEKMIYLGAHAFEEIKGEVVQTTSFVLRSTQKNDDSYKGTYIRLADSTSQQEKEKIFLAKNNQYIVPQKIFSLIPKKPIVFWLSTNELQPYKNNLPLLGSVVNPCAGLSTGNNNKFQRHWYEVCFENIGFEVTDVSQTENRKEKWYPCNSGGEFRKWSTDNLIVVNWKNNGNEIRQYRNNSGNLGAIPRNSARYFKEGITWNKLSTSRFAAKYKDCGFIFDDTSRSAFPQDLSKIFYYIGSLCSCVTLAYLQALNPTLSFTNSDIERVPMLVVESQVEIVTAIVQECIDYSKEDWNSFENSWNFQRHPMIGNTRTIKEGFNKWQSECNKRFYRLKANEEKINHIFIGIYGLQNELLPEESDEDVTVRKADLGRDIRSLISYAVGCMFGRYSLDEEGLIYAGGYFDVGRYRSFKVDTDNIIPITDEEYFNDDIVGRFIEFIKTVYGEDTLEENLEYIAKALGNKGDTSREVIRNYFEKDFIKDHIKIYKKRPIYWLFNSGKQDGFKALIYMHRYDENTVSNVRTEYLHKVQDVYAKTIEGDQFTINNSTSKSDVNKARKHIAKLQKQLDETKQYDMALAHIANERISLDLDDGVKVNYEKFQNVEIINDNGKKVKINLLEKI